MTEKSERNRAVAAAAKEGRKPRDIAAQFGITAGRVRQILAWERDSENRNREKIRRAERKLAYLAAEKVLREHGFKVRLSDAPGEHSKYEGWTEAYWYKSETGRWVYFDWRAGEPDVAGALIKRCEELGVDCKTGREVRA